MTTWVVGAGYVGSEVVARLAERGDVVFSGRRRPHTPAAPARAWITDLTGAVIPPEGVRRVVFAQAPDQGDEASYRAIYYDGTLRALDALRDAPLERVVFVSSTSVYGDTLGDIDETTRVAPTTPTATWLARAEAEVAQRSPAVILRLAGLYGPGRTRLVRMVREGTARASTSCPIGNRIHRDDAAEAIVRLLEVPVAPPIVLGVDDAPVPLAEVTSWIAAQLGLPAPATTEALDARGGASRRCRNTLLRALGVRLRWPTYREGYGPLLRES